ncbi:hypothetical protein OH491_08860 [Termitidicoccus mucosus]|uniref:hypothetical protein n=1 Tax=Termitidicoccus mucosus TaxID=1184151 RepID=UPI0011AB5DD0
MAALLQDVAFLPPVELDSRKAGIEVHCVMHSRDIQHAIWGLASFFYFAGNVFSLVVHADNEWTPEQLALFGGHFRGVKIIPRAESDVLMSDVLKEFPACHRYRRSGAYGRKLFDPYLLRSLPCLILLDSDVLFFRKPNELLDIVSADADTLLYNLEIGEGYASKPALMAAFPKLHTQFNAGLIATRPPENWPGLFEELIPTLEHLRSTAGLRPGSDQLPLACVAHWQGWRPLHSSYSSNPERFRKNRTDFTSMHFHSWAREGFTIDGIPWFLTTINAA